MEVKRLPLMVSLTFLLTAFMVLRALVGKVGGASGCTCCTFVCVSMGLLDFPKLSRREGGAKLRVGKVDVIGEKSQKRKEGIT